MTLVSRDPFAREELHRERIYSPHAVCAWCGRTLYTPKRRPYVYRYRIESDAGRTSELSGMFCSVSCLRTWNGRGHA